MKKHFVSGVAGILLLAGCDLTVAPSESNFAYSTFVVERDEVSGDLIIEPTTMFFRASQASLADSRLMGDGCSVQPVDEFHIPVNLQHINGGDSVLVESATNKVALKPVTIPQRTEYRRVGPPRLVALHTDTLRITTFGGAGGFPPRTHRIAMVRPAVFEPVVIPATAVTMEVRWSNATNDPAAKVEVSLPYRDIDDDFVQVVCVFSDTGVGSVPAAATTGLRLAEDPMAGRGLRFRANFQQSGGNVIAAMIYAESGIEVEAAPVP